MTENEKAIYQKLKDDYRHYAAKCLKIRTKEGKIEPFIFNRSQIYLDDKVEDQRRRTGRVRALVLKGRQKGISTYVEGRFYWKVTHRFGVRAFILTHDAEATNNLFDMAKRYHENCHALVKPSTDLSNAKELIFGRLDSGYKLGTAGNKAVGRSSTIQYLHGSEVAFWPNAAEHAKGILQAVPNAKDTEIFLESTANGVGGYFHEQWQLAEAGLSDFIAIFLPWYWQSEYERPIDAEFAMTDEEVELQQIYGLSREQINWRRYKIIELSVGGADGTKAFMQEYPCTPTEAFQTTGEDAFITPAQVMPARKCETEGVGLKLLGVDVARYGDDRTSIIRRQGRKAYGLESYVKKDTMEVCGIVHNIITSEDIDKVFVDVIGVGAGVYDRLLELGHGERLVAVNSGHAPLNSHRFMNRRAEMWWNMREWLHEQPSQIPDSDSLHADLCAPKYKPDSRGRIVIEKKEDIKKRGLRSPDEAEALLMTFYYPASALVETKRRSDADMAKKVMSTYNQNERLRRIAFKRK